MEISFLQWGFCIGRGADCGKLVPAASAQGTSACYGSDCTDPGLGSIWECSEKKQPVKNDIAWNPQTILPGLFPKFASKGVTPAEVCQPNKFRS